MQCSLSLHLARSSGSNINLTTSGNSLSTLPIYVYVSSPGLPIASHMAPHSRLGSLIRNTPQASAPHFRTGALFHFQNALNRDEKGHLPPNLCIYSTFCFYPLLVWLRCQLHPMKVLFILHAKSLARLALRAPPNPEAGFRPLPSQVCFYLLI